MVFGLDRNAPIGIAAARVERCPPDRLIVVSEPNPPQRALGGLFLLVACYFCWSLVSGIATAGWVGLWPGALAAPFFAAVGLVLCVGSERVEIDAERHLTRIERRLLAWCWRDEVRLPYEGTVTVRATRSRAAGIGGAASALLYTIALADRALPRFTCGEQERARRLAQDVAELLHYRYIEIADDEVARTLREPPIA